MSARRRAPDAALSPLGGESATDNQLVTLALQRDEAAIRILVKRNNQRLFRIARSVMQDDLEAEDIVQETYMRAFTTLDRFRKEAAFSTWLTRIAINEAYGRLRRKRAVTNLDEIENQRSANEAQIIQFPLISVTPDPEAEAGRGQVRRLLEEAIDRLPENFRLVFILRDIEGLGVEARATLLSLKPQTVKSRLFRARRHLREELEKTLAKQFSDVYPFAGRRCEGMAERVIKHLRALK